MISGSKTGNCVFVFLNDTQMLLTYVIIMSRGVVLKNKVGERTQKTSHFQQNFKLIFSHYLLTSITLYKRRHEESVGMRSRTQNKCGNAVPTRSPHYTPDYEKVITRRSLLYLR